MCFHTQISLLLSTTYNSDIPPWANVTASEGIYQVGLKLLIESIPTISEPEQTINAEMFLTMIWEDKRLAYEASNISFRTNYTNFHRFSFWKPDVYIVNARKIISPEIHVPAQLFRVYPNGTIRTSKKINFDFTCNMDFRNFPFDHQECPVKLESYAYTDEELMLRIDDESVDFAEGLVLNKYDYEIKVKKPRSVLYHSGHFSRIEVDLILKRKISYYLIQVYFPSAMFSILAYFALLIPMEFVPGNLEFLGAKDCIRFVSIILQGGL